MFTGIVSAIGTITRSEQRGDLRLRITCPWEPEDIAIGASIACSGVCLTVVERGREAGNPSFAVDVSGETVSRSVPGMWAEGRALNLERALRMGDELGGHLVTGHVDAVATVRGLCPEGASIRIGFTAPADLAPYIAPKGSITIDGVSLTVNEVSDNPDGSCNFAVNIIPHTAEVTTLGRLAQGDAVNIEIDTLARYLQRMNSLRG